MSEINKFLEKINLSYNDLEKLFKNEYKINVKNFFHEPNIYCLEFTHKSDFNKKIIRQCTGIVIEKHTNRILHYFGEKTYKKIKNINIDKDGYDVVSLEDINFDNIYIRSYKEGPILKLFYHEHKWKYITTPCKIKDNFWKIINDCFESKSDFTNVLDKTYCYSFIINNEKISFVNKTDLITLNVFLDNNTNEVKFKNIKLCEYEDNKINLFLIEKNKNNEIITKIKITPNDLKILKGKL